MKKTFTLLLLGTFIFSCKSEKQQNEESAITTNSEETGIFTESPINSAIQIEPFSHATTVIDWSGSTIYLDPTGGAKAFDAHEEPDLVLITDIHSDHMDAETLQALNLGQTTIIAPQKVKDELPENLHKNIRVMNNGEVMDFEGMTIRAIPMYNLREEAKHFHPQGRGNGYLIEKNSERLYIAGDTEGIPEMRNLENIDVALVPMNLPYTMPVDAAADAVADFQPKKVYPYHYRGEDGKADVEKFKNLVEEKTDNVEVVLVEWYPNQ